MTPTLEMKTPRLIVREFLLTDWTEVHAYSADPEVVKYVEWGPNTEEDTIHFILMALSAQRDNPRTEYHLALTRRTDGRLIGSCALHFPEITENRAVIGYVLHRDFWGQGYATEAATAMVEFGIARLGRGRIEATCDVKNTASARVLEKAGLKQEKILLKHKLQKGIWRDSFLYAIGEAEWNARSGTKWNIETVAKASENA